MSGVIGVAAASSRVGGIAGARWQRQRGGAARVWRQTP